MGQVDQCQSLNSTCYCDKSCFKRRDCCEDIFSKNSLSWYTRTCARCYIPIPVYVVEMEASSMQVIEGSTIQVCAVLTGRFEKTEDDVVVSVNFIDSQFAGDTLHITKLRTKSWLILYLAQLEERTMRSTVQRWCSLPCYWDSSTQETLQSSVSVLTLLSTVMSRESMCSQWRLHLCPLSLLSSALLLATLQFSSWTVMVYT